MNNKFLLDISDAALETVSIHHVGNKFFDDGFFTTEKPLHLADDTSRSLLSKFLLSSFAKSESWSRIDNSHASIDVVHELFDNQEAFHSLSKKVAEMLYYSSVHPKINQGELYVVWMEGLKFNHEITNAIGLFKASTKETFLNAEPGEKDYELSYSQGFDLNKCDYGMLVLNVEREQGYVVNHYQNCKKDASVDLFWTEHFMMLQKINTEYDHTSNLIGYVNHFINAELPENYEVSKLDLAVYRNRADKYFNDNETFDQEQFNQQVLKQPEIIDLYNKQKEAYAEANDVTILPEQNINDKAVKKNRKFLKSVIKLDKNFHLYVHGNEDFVQRGFDEEQGLNYYKIYFKNEE